MSNSLLPLGLQHASLPCPSPSSWSWLKLMSIELVMPSNHLILCRPLLLPPSIFPSNRIFSNASALCLKWPKYWSFSISFCTCENIRDLLSANFKYTAQYCPLQSHAVHLVPRLIHGIRGVGGPVLAPEQALLHWDSWFLKVRHLALWHQLIPWGLGSLCSVPTSW